MSDSTPTSELIDRLAKQSGIRKKLAAELLYAIPEIIEEGLKRDGEVRVKGLGTFRMKWTQARPGRNPKTGESVEIPPRYRLVFLPEQSLKEFINRDFRLLSYKVIPEDRSQKTEVRRQKAEDRSQKTEDRRQSSVVSQQSSVVSRQSSVSSQQSAVMSEQEPELPVPSYDEVDEEIDNDFGSEIPVRKRRIHWIIPAAISVIIVLSLIFYFRNFIEKKTVDRSLKTEDRSQKTEDSSQKSEDRSQKTEDRSQKTEVGGQQSIIGAKSTQIDNRQSTIDNRQSSVTISEGQHLFKLAREVYGNPFLWVLIYKANLDLIPDPDQAISGREIKIPILEGTPDQLSRNDSLEISEGYRLVYEFYKVNGDDRSDDYFKGSVRYKPQ